MSDPRIIKVSASALRAYEECPYKYAMDYIRRLPNTQRAPVPIFAVGNAVHQTLAEFSKKGGRSQVDRDEIASMLMQNWDSRPFRDPDEELAHFHRAKAMVESFHDKPYPGKVAQELGIEKYVAWSRPRNGVIAVGRLDRVCLLEDGTLEVVDYKTGSRVIEEEALEKEYQALFYRTLVAQQFPRIKPKSIRVTFHYLATGRSVSVEYQHEEFQEWWGGVEFAAERIRQAIREHEEGAPIEVAFPRRRGDRCRACPMQLHCSEVVLDRRLGANS
ncbi:ATP-dependent helicase/deoxyribonuclease subunit B [compost metagenome]